MTPAAMGLHIEQASALGARLVFAPAQQIPAMPDEVLRAGLDRAWLVAGNAYELEMITRAHRPIDRGVERATHGRGDQGGVGERAAHGPTASR